MLLLILINIDSITDILYPPLIIFYNIHTKNSKIIDSFINLITKMIKWENIDQAFTENFESIFATKDRKSYVDTKIKNAHKLIP